MSEKPHKTASHAKNTEIAWVILAPIDWPKHGVADVLMRVGLHAGPLARSALFIGEQLELRCGETLVLGHRLSMPSARNAIRRLVPLNDGMALHIPVMLAAFEAADENEFGVWVIRPEAERDRRAATEEEKT